MRGQGLGQTQSQCVDTVSTDNDMVSRGELLNSTCTCSKCTVEGEEKFWSIDDRFNQCGEACMKPEDYDKFHKFEKNLLPADNTNTPCCDNGYCMYKQTTSHGPDGSSLSMTFDMYDK